MSASTNINNKQPDALITDHIDVWASAIKRKSTQGRGSSKKVELYGIKKLRELILELAVRGLLVPQYPNDEPASELLKKIAAEKEQLAKEGKIKKQKPLPPIEESEKPFKLLNNGWVWTQLGEIAEIAPRNALDDDMEVGFVPMPMITTSYDGSHEQEVRPWGTIKKGYTHFSNGDIALAKITPCFENSKAAVFRGLKNGYGAGTTELHIARPIQDTVNPLYILLYLKAPMFLEKGKSKMTGSAGQKRIPNSYFSGNPLPLPPLQEQHRIVTKVNELMALCGQLEQQQETSINAHQTLVETLLNALVETASHTQGEEGSNKFQQAWQRIAENFDLLFTTEHSIQQLKQTILQLAVMGKLVLQASAEERKSPDYEPASVLLEKIAKEKAQLIKDKKIKKQKPLPPIGDQEKPFELPDRWEWCNLQGLISLMDAGWSPACPPEASPSNDKWGVLKTTAVQSMEYWAHENKVLADTKEPRPQYEVKAGDILITRAGPKNRVGVSCLVQTTRPKLMISDKIIRFHLVEVGMSERYISLCLNAGATAEFLEKSKSGMAESQMNISQDKLKAAPIPLCPIQEQHRIVKKVDELMSLCDNMLERIKAAQTTQLNITDAIAQKITGNDASIKNTKDEDISLMKIVTNLSLGSVTPDQSALIAPLINEDDGVVDAKSIWNKTKLPLPEFYKQLKKEIEAGFINKPPQARAEG